LREFRASYRLQLTPEFGFREARAVVPYLRSLGVSHLYLSPSFEARRGSTHGYDVTDPTRIRGELGGEAEFLRLCAAGLDVILDVVPNHMAGVDENPYWPDPKVFDIGRRFFDVDELVGVRQEDPDVFELTHRKALELVEQGVVQGLRIDHPDGLADPAGYLERLRARGVAHVWVEKILEPGEHMRDWPVEGTTGYEFANDLTALFVDGRGEGPLTELYAELAGERRQFADVAHEAKIEQAKTTFQPEFDRLRRLYDDDRLETAAASLYVYRTYVEPWSGRVTDEDRRALAGVDEELLSVLLLERRGYDEFVTRFQQTTAPVTAKGVEDTALYRWLRLIALNEVGGNPERFTLPVEEFHRGNLERVERFPNHMLTTQTHDTKRSGDVRARIGVLSERYEEWAQLVRRWRVLEDPNEDYLLWQTLVGTWPIERERLDAYMHKALREAKRTTSWIEPNERHERAVSDAIARVYERSPDGFEAFAAEVAARGREVSLAQTLLKLTCPGFGDIYQGDEHESLALVDPDNRRPVDWTPRRSPKSDLIRRVLALRSERARAFAGAYEPLELGPDTCGFVRGGDVLVAVPLRAGSSIAERPGWRDLLPEHPFTLAVPA